MKYGKIIIGIIVVLLVGVLIFLSIINNLDSHFDENSVSLWELEEYNVVKLEDIKTIHIVSYTEAGMDTKTIQDEDEIKEIYQALSKLRIGQEVELSCDDNSIVYYLNMRNGEDISIELDCNNILVLPNKRFEVGGTHEIRRRN
ncbi:MAG: hypothetical protein IKF71_03815 [Bacilli bacterium]|nr:hypothetical protein [Bacilli bacterium]